jgi:hypothetical protein
VIGDVNGDHKADITAFEHGQGGGFGVYVSLSNSTFSGRANFAARGLWADGFCFSTEECAVGDVNGEGKADIIVFQHGTGVYVGLSEVWLREALPPYRDYVRFSFDGQWADGFCFSTEECAVGDVNGDGKADIIVFQHGYPGSPKTGVYVGLSDVWLLPSKPQLRFATPFQKWHDNFCVWHRDDKSEYADQCMVGDVNGDDLTDIVAFNHGKAPGV